MCLCYMCQPLYLVSLSVSEVNELKPITWEVGSELPGKVHILPVHLASLGACSSFV